MLSKKKPKAFTILEVMIAMLIVSLGLTAAIGLVISAFASSSFNTSKLIAAYLAQEGMEIVRNIRDSNWLTGNDWRDNLTDGDWEADYQATSLNSCPSLCNYNDLHFLKIDSNGFYNYNSGSVTNFKRKITIGDGDDNSFLVIVEVFWEERGKKYNLKAQEILYNWNP